MTNTPELPRRLGAVIAILVGAAFGCGARTELYGFEPCGSVEDTRACSNACGQGTQVCRDGYWQACEVRTTTRACSNACGDGTQQCSSGAWEACQVEVVAAPCQTLCGAGESRCENGAWGSCEVPIVTRDCETVCGFGHETCVDGVWQACDAPQPKPPQLRSTIRDFDDTHPDFERAGWGRHEAGMVEPVLGSDDKPVYTGNPTTVTTSGKEYFDQWYRDTPGVNLSMPLDLQLEAEEGEPVFFAYSDNTFFPIDGQLLGNQGRSHNFHFTLEAQTTFTYIGGEVFSFSGDDDMWVFINRHLAIDLGGLHVSMSDSVNLDDVAAEFGMALGGTYPIHFFFAERHTIDSNFTIRTTVAEAGSCE